DVANVLVIRLVVDEDADDAVRTSPAAAAAGDLGAVAVLAVHGASTAELAHRMAIVIAVDVGILDVGLGDVGEALLGVVPALEPWWWRHPRERSGALRQRWLVAVTIAVTGVRKKQ